MTELKKLHLISHYCGKPTVGIATSTGTLTICTDRLVFDSVLGNAMAGMFGAVGLGLSMKKKTDTYLYTDIANVEVTRYIGVMPMLTVVMKNGEQHSFTGTVFNANDCWTLIQKHMPGHSSEPDKNAPPVASSAAEVPQNETNGYQNIFYFQGNDDYGPKHKGTLAVKEAGLAFSEKDRPELCLLYTGMKAVGASQYMNICPLLEVVMKDDTKHSFFANDMAASAIADAIKRMIPEPEASAPRMVCKYCNHVYEEGDMFCTECGGIDTVAVDQNAQSGNSEDSI